ncbi:hypothetical protein GCM10007207_23420 [Asaia siamensis]|uniref:Uncharacterized protein n=1 Tax=Asaia siamensis TaxID=110479 RepID=A0ABQ1ME76_9PROT|nr:hypothetical protein AA0323_1786 [Asaia siamensis NRIC 0323]GGC37156.1 hypothetical protein GCM10007207_23420 [Asaia siamensis]
MAEKFVNDRYSARVKLGLCASGLWNARRASMLDTRPYFITDLLRQYQFDAVQSSGDS